VLSVWGAGFKKGDLRDGAALLWEHESARIKTNRDL